MIRDFALLAVALVVSATLAGCAARHVAASYRLIDQDRALLLIPPGIKDPAIPQASFLFPTGTRPGPRCVSAEPATAVKPRRSALRITVRRQPLLGQAQGWLTRWAATVEQKGCIAPGKASQLAARIADAVPLDPAIAATLLRPNLRAGYVDLGPEHRLRVIAPILREGAKSGIEVAQVTGAGRSLTLDLKASPDLLGYELVWYSVEPRPDGNGSRIAFVSAESHIGDKVTQNSAPRLDHLRFSPDARYFRLLFLSRNSQSDHDTAILAARTPAELDLVSSRFEGGPAEFTGTADAEWCLLVPPRVAVLPHLAVTVNGKEARIAVQTSLFELIRAAGEPNPADVVPTLVVRRIYNGQYIAIDFDRSRHGILGLPIQGGEDIQWAASVPARR